MITFGSGVSTISSSWGAFKQVVLVKVLSIQFTADAGVYLIFAFDGSLVYTTQIWLGAVPDGVAQTYSQEQNDSDKADFEGFYKASANSVIERRENDGRSSVRFSMAAHGLLFRLRVFSFKTAALDSVHNLSPDGVDYADVTLKIYDDQNVEITDPVEQANAVKTVVDYEAKINQELRGGWLDVPAGISGGVTGKWFVSVLGAPDIPVNYGGCLDFVSEVNLEATRNTKIEMDGQATSFVPYDVVYHSGKIRFTFKHPVGEKQLFQLYMEVFR